MPPERIRNVPSALTPANRKSLGKTLRNGFAMRSCTVS